MRDKTGIGLVGTDEGMDKSKGQGQEQEPERVDEEEEGGGELGNEIRG